MEGQPKELQTPLLQREFHKLIHHVLEYTVFAANHVVAAEISFARQSLLHTPDGGFFVDPYYSLTPAQEQVLRELRSQHAAMSSLGVGIAGVLWERAVKNSLTTWHSLQHVIMDEETPHDSRTHKLAQLFSYAAGVPLHGTCGLLILYSRTNPEKESSGAPEDSAFLVASASLCSAALSTIRMVPQHISAWEKVRKAKWTILSLNHSYHNQRSWALFNYLDKWRGSGAPSLAPASCGQAALATLFTGVAGLSLALFNDYCLELSHGQSSVLFAPLGALMCMNFSAPNSPLGQPRNVICGNVMAACVSLSLSMLQLPRFLEVAIAPAISIGLMSKLGVTHPPAGAVSLLVAMSPEKYDWRWLVFPLVAGNFICCTLAVMLNNLSPKRQFPLFW